MTGGAGEGPARVGRDEALRGRRILVTRPREQSAELVELLEGWGAEVLQIPAIRIEGPSNPEDLLRAARDSSEFDWVVLTSANGVERFADACEQAFGDESMALPLFCAIGPGTAAAVKHRFGRVDLVAEVHTAEGVVEALEARGEIAGRRFLLPQAAAARGVLAASLRDRGGDVVQVEAYRTLVDASSAERLRHALETGRVDMVTFTSTSSVRSVLELVDRRLQGPAIATIGPITSAAARAEGLAVDVEADPHSIPGLIDGILRYYGAEDRPSDA